MHMRWVIQIPKKESCYFNPLTTIDVKKAPISVDMDDLLTATSVSSRYVVFKYCDKVLVYSYRNRSWVLFNQFNAHVFTC